MGYIGIYASYQKILALFSSIGGWLGNQPFNESVLVFDTVYEEFAVKPAVNIEALEMSK